MTARIQQWEFEYIHMWLRMTTLSAEQIAARTPFSVSRIKRVSVMVGNRNLKNVRQAFKLWRLENEKA